MAAATQAQRQFRVKSPLGDDVLLLREMKGHEQLGRLSEFNLELLSENSSISIPDILGQSVTVEVDMPRGGVRYFNGICTRFAQVGQQRNFIRYQAQLHPWFWLLTRTGDCRIFQEMKIPDVIKQVFRDLGFSDFEDTLSRNYRTWEYLVQYRESTFDFVSRLMEQEGIYYYFKHEDGKHKLVLSDDYSSHEPYPNYDTVMYFPPDEHRVRVEDHLSQWELAQAVQTCEYTIDNYDFKKPKTELLVKTSQPRQHAHADKKYYDFFGEYKVTGEGDQYVKNRLQEQQADYEVVQGSGDCRGIGSGSLFSLDGYHRDDQNREYLITSSSWHLEQDWFETTDGGGAADNFSCSLTAIDAKTPFRPARVTPKPRAMGPHTAVVVGPSGEEIWTDEHGRIKVQFHWDREGKFDENSSCWMRVKQVMAGNSWGTIWLPRIGHEVVVDFIEGDPDRPLVVGSVYNGDNKVPYPLPDNKTQSGVKTRSSKKGDPTTFNELRFEDLKGEEHIYFHAEKDFERIVENNDTLKVGFDDKDKGDQTIEIHNNRTLTVGNSQSADGSQTTTIWKDRTGSLETGSDALTIKAGDQTTQVKAGKIFTQAAKSIELKVGQSSIKLEPTKITLKSVQIAIEGQTTVDVKGSAMLNLKGGIININ